MGQIYLAVNNGLGWKLEPFETPEAALTSAMFGGACGNEWKIVHEMDITKIDTQQIHDA